MSHSSLACSMMAPGTPRATASRLAVLAASRCPVARQILACCSQQRSASLSAPFSTASCRRSARMGSCVMKSMFRHHNCNRGVSFAPALLLLLCNSNLSPLCPPQLAPPSATAALALPKKKLLSLLQPVSVAYFEPVHYCSAHVIPKRNLLPPSPTPLLFVQHRQLSLQRQDAL